MGKDEAFCVVFSEDKNFGMEFSDEFLGMSVEKQMETLKALLREKHLAPVSAENVSKTVAESEIIIILLESLLAKLRRGERIEMDTSVGVFLEDLELPFNTWD